jgi:organic radical activating enzyme
LSLSSLADEFKVKENEGLSKLERINSLESYILKMESAIGLLSGEVAKIDTSEKLSKSIEELSSSHKKIKKELETLRTSEISQLRKDLEFVDQQKVEKLIDKVVKYQEDTDKRIKFLEDSLKEVHSKVNTVSTPKEK